MAWSDVFLCWGGATFIWWIALMNESGNLKNLGEKMRKFVDRNWLFVWGVVVIVLYFIPFTPIIRFLEIQMNYRVGELKTKLEMSRLLLQLLMLFLGGWGIYDAWKKLKRFLLDPKIKMFFNQGLRLDHKILRLEIANREGNESYKVPLLLRNLRNPYGQREGEEIAGEEIVVENIEMRIYKGELKEKENPLWQISEDGLKARLKIKKFHSLNKIYVYTKLELPGLSYCLRHGNRDNDYVDKISYWISFQSGKTMKDTLYIVDSKNNRYRED